MFNPNSSSSSIPYINLKFIWLIINDRPDNDSRGGKKVGQPVSDSGAIYFSAS